MTASLQGGRNRPDKAYLIPSPRPKAPDQTGGEPKEQDMKGNTQGFTLIELLIVIAIIGILAAVLIPNLLGARDKARDAAAQACASDLIKQAEIFQVDKNTYAGFDATGDYAPGTACAKDKQVKDWSITAGADANNVAGTVTSLSSKATVFAWDNKNGIVKQ